VRRGVPESVYGQMAMHGNIRYSQNHHRVRQRRSSSSLLRVCVCMHVSYTSPKHTLPFLTQCITTTTYRYSSSTFSQPTCCPQDQGEMQEASLVSPPHPSTSCSSSSSSLSYAAATAAARRLPSSAAAAAAARSGSSSARPPPPRQYERQTWPGVQDHHQQQASNARGVQACWP